LDTTGPLIGTGGVAQGIFPVLGVLGNIGTAGDTRVDGMDGGMFGVGGPAQGFALIYGSGIPFIRVSFSTTVVFAPDRLIDYVWISVDGASIPAYCGGELTWS
jgi:hypothetical protein